jgi:dienelactone hydrolase
MRSHEHRREKDQKMAGPSSRVRVTAMTGELASRARRTLLPSVLAVSALVLGAPGVALAGTSPVGDEVSTGPLSFTTQLPVVAYTPPDLPTHTVFRPESVRGKLPVVVWENGGCVNDNSVPRPFLERVAASGFLVIAKAPIDAPLDPGNVTVTPESDVLTPAPGTPLPPAAPPLPGGTFPREALSGGIALMQSAIDWAETANGLKGGDLRNRIDLEKIAVTGWSCGGFTAIGAAVVDDRIDSVLGFNTASSPFVTAPQPTREDLLQLDVPIAWIIGGPGDIAYTGFQADWAMPLTVPMFQAQHPYLVHQLGWSSQESQLEFAEIAIYWLDLTLSGNKQAGQYLLGTPCGFCDNPNWTTESRNWDPRFSRG